MDSRMYETLNAIPLFQGMNGIELNHILETCPLRIECLEKGDTLSRQGELARNLTVLLSGRLRASVSTADDCLVITEEVPCPSLIECDVLYGIQREWGATYTAKEDCTLLLIPKEDVNRMMGTMEIFRLNYLNAVCTLSARRRRRAWTEPAPTLRERIALFVKTRTLGQTGPVEVRIRMRDLGSHLGATRSLVSMVLHKMQDDGVLRLERGRIIIPELKDLR
ncbi:MAG: Crp/Fnr family transcriptional regulator [Prevotellaceae bacterium]|nr:Crp/Fnr family transcriptional regulator [Prevotellaceae bacterium]